jgi:hypothetical protein
MNALCELEEPVEATANVVTLHRLITTPAFASIVLACLGGIDLVRGVLHTFFVQHSAVKIAGLNLAHSGQDQLLLLGSFGISNFLTGFIYIAVALKAKQLVPTVLALIPLSYLLGFIAFRMNNITPEAEFPGRSFMLVYCGICVLAFLGSMYVMRRNPLRNANHSACASR